MRGLLRTLGLAVVCCLPAAVAEACIVWSPQPVRIWADAVQIDVNDQIATKTYSITFKNPNPYETKGGKCYLEIEPGAPVQQMSVLVDGVEMPAEILDVEKARKVFEELVKEGGSPALLESYGFQLIETQLPRISVNGSATVRVKYTTVLKSQGGVVRLRVANNHPRGLSEPLNASLVSVNLRSKAPLKNIYSPTHEIKLVEKEDWDVAVEWRAEQHIPRHPFVLYYQIAEDNVAATLLAHRELDEDGTFMLMLSPTLGQGAGRVTEEQVLPKDVVFCVDASGSMLQGRKMEQARAALQYCVEHLREGDRFNIVDFSSTVRQLEAEGLLDVNKESRRRGLDYVAAMNARGGTAIHDALVRSLELLTGDGESANRSDKPTEESIPARLKMIVFTTDGLPTMGERDPQQILRSVSKRNTDDVRIFVFGEGYDVNTQLLDFLALDHRGEADYILPEEDIAEKISRFFDRVGSPILTDVEIDFAGLEVDSVHPARIPDVFRGEQVIVYGRYRGFGEKTITVSGMAGGERRTFTYTVNFPEYSEDDAHSFVPRLWAGRRVNVLLNEIRKNTLPDQQPGLQGNPDEIQKLVDEVTYLAKRFGIVTPYTSYLLADNIAQNPPPGPQLGDGVRPLKKGRELEQDRLLNRIQGVQTPQAPAAAAEARVRESRALAAARRSGEKSGGAAAFDAFAEHSAAKERQNGDAKSAANGAASAGEPLLRTIGARTFYRRDGVWQESGYADGEVEIAKTVAVGSEDFFALLKEDPRLARYLSLGDVILSVGGQWYRFQTASQP